MRRITTEDLDRVVVMINNLQGVDSRPRTKVGGKLVPTAWNYHIGGAYGGWRLEQHGSSGSEIRDVFQVGYVPKRELYGLLQAYSAGIIDGSRDYEKEDAEVAAIHREEEQANFPNEGVTV